MSSAVLNVDDVEGTGVTFTVDDGSYTTLVTTLGDHDEVTDVEGNVTGDLSGFDGNTDGVVLLDERIGESDGSTVMGNNGGNSLISNSSADNTA